MVIGMLTEHDISIRVRYCETDAMGYLHHANFAIYYEMGRTELLRAQGGNYREIEDSGLFLVVAASIYFGNAKLLFLLPVVGYGFAWLGHFAFEKNKLISTKTYGTPPAPDLVNTSILEADGSGTKLTGQMDAVLLPPGMPSMPGMEDMMKKQLITGIENTLASYKKALEG